MERDIKPMQDVEKYMPSWQIKKVISETYNSKGYKKDRDVLLITMLAFTGRRSGELLLMQTKDVMIEDRKVVFNILKKKLPTRKIKEIHDDLFNLLVTYIKTYNLQPEDYIFKSSWKENSPISSARVRQIVYKYVDRAGLPKFPDGKRIHPHTFRHSFAVETAKNLENPADLRVLQQEMEHSSINVTTFYLQFNNMESRKLLKKLYVEQPPISDA